MNKDKLKGFAAGVAATLLVSTTVVPAVAAGVTKTAELYYNNIKVVIEGKRADLKDALGNPVEPFTINGTTYLPVRAVANALDMAVDWDGKTQTVYLGASEEMEQPSVWLKDLDVFAGRTYNSALNEVEFGGPAYNSYFTDNTGKVYDNYMSIYTDVSYILNGKYKTLKGTWYLTNQDKNSSTEWRILVYGDDEMLYASESVMKGSMPAEINVDVSNVMVMKIVVQYYTGNYWSTLNANSYTALLGNAGLYVPQEAEDEAAAESETEPVDTEVAAE
ncbi:MAG: copper amine oxidase [Ruminococcaceae bacterium]|nr:copper amine oxidase [Oscillospiraceae bacterium]